VGRAAEPGQLLDEKPLPLLSLLCFSSACSSDGEKKRKDYAFRRQFNEKPSIIPGCPAQ